MEIESMIKAVYISKDLIPEGVSAIDFANNVNTEFIDVDINKPPNNGITVFLVARLEMKPITMVTPTVAEPKLNSEAVRKKRKSE